MAKQAVTLIHLHIPKAAGSTLNHILEEQVPAARSYATSMTAHHPEGSLSGFQALSATERDRLDLIYGHMPFGLHRQLPRPAEYIVLLREPVSRLISNYFFEGREPLSALYEQVRSGAMDVGAYLDFLRNHGIDNIQTRMVAGIYDPGGGPPLTSALLTQAKTNLERHVAVVGLKEAFEDSYLLLRRRYGWPFSDYRRHNVAPRRQQSAELPPAVLERIAREQAYDQALYTFARELFARQVAAAGPALALDRFRFRFWRRRRQFGEQYRRARLFSLRHYLRSHWSRPGTRAGEEH